LQLGELTSPAMTVATSPSERKVFSYLEAALLVAAVIVWLQLRKSVRIVSEAPDELLDERQIALRNAAYVVAYRWMSTLAVLFVLLVMALAEGGVMPQAIREVVRMASWSGLHMSFLMSLVALPSMVLAWQLPSEPQDEPA
jgi:hypothetical protein